MVGGNGEADRRRDDDRHHRAGRLLGGGQVSSDSRTYRPQLHEDKVESCDRIELVALRD